MKDPSADLVELMRICSTLELDCMRVLIAIAHRLQVGRAAYGEMNIEGDTRDFRKEGCEELLDFIVYETMDRLRDG